MSAIAMLNALWFRPDGGADRYYNDYASAVLPLLGAVQADVVVPFLQVEDALEGDFAPDVLGVVRYPSAEAFDAMISSSDYRPAAEHARAALERRVLTMCSIDYAAGDALSPAPGILVANILWLREGGAQRYEEYLDVARPLVQGLGGQFLAPRLVPQRAVEDDFLPDLVFFGNYPSKESVFELVSSPDYQERAAPIRAQAVARSMTALLRVPA